MLCAAQASIQLGDEEHAFPVLLAEGSGAHLAEGSRFLTAHVTLMPRALPFSCSTNTGEKTELSSGIKGR